MHIIDIIQNGIFFSDGVMDSIPLWVLGIVVSMVVPYLLGSLNFAIIISAKQYKEDIRSYGSKNAGMTNMMRTYGKSAAALTLLGDALKSVVSCIIGYLMLGYLGCYIAGLFCVIGHMFPVFYRFKGGKGVVTGAMAILMSDPIVFAIVLLIFIIIVVFTKYISLGSVMSVLLYPFLLDRICKLRGYVCPYTIFAFLIMILVLIKHYENIKRLFQGKENKFSFKKSSDAAKAHQAEIEAQKAAVLAEPEEEEAEETVVVTKRKKINKNYGKKKK
ncbi:MAG: glycerol-3-phosphate 1-O-acyltransferase PlsY [Ruminococcaceae bacterium]|nr:glycerol-3-phosphate 1-O-acyltransferase PlsY [Oscillospiraceae bacterium]